MYIKLGLHRYPSSESGDKHTHTLTHSHEMRISKQTVPLPALEWLLTHNLDLVSHKGYPLPDTYHLDKSLQIYKCPKVSIKDNHKTI